MAWLEQRGNGFRIKFRHSGQNLQCPLKAEDRKDAENCLARFEENYRLYLRGRLLPPADADLGIFLLSDGKLNHTPELKPTVTLGQLFDHYRTHHPEGVKEANTKKMEEYHMAHLERIIKKSTPLCEVNRQRLVENPAPTKGLLFAKEQVKPPFQTWEQIERQAKNPKLTKHQVSDLWERLFLNTVQIKEFLSHVEQKAEAWLYAAFCFACYTGARRSEICRVQVEDLNFTTNTVHIREKRDRSKAITFRVVPLAKALQTVLRSWLSQHPGGSFLFTKDNQEGFKPYQLSWEFRKLLNGNK